jgi:hypothetical protein
VHVPPGTLTRLGRTSASFQAWGGRNANRTILGALMIHVIEKLWPISGVTYSACLLFSISAFGLFCFWPMPLKNYSSHLEDKNYRELFESNYFRTTKVSQSSHSNAKIEIFLTKFSLKILYRVFQKHRPRADIF